MSQILASLPEESSQGHGCYKNYWHFHSQDAGKNEEQLSEMNLKYILVIANNM